MEVEEFGFGIPPRLYKWKKFGTLVTLNAIPIGGFVRVKGGDSFAVDKKDFKDPKNYHSKTWWQRFWFISAGVIMNFILAVFILAICYMVGMKPLPGTDLYENSRKFEGILVSEVMKDSPSEKAGLEKGDLILKVDGIKFQETSFLIDHIKSSENKINLLILRDKEELNIDIKPNEEKKIGVYMGISEDIQEVRLLPHKAFYYAAYNTAFIAKETFFGIFNLFVGILTKFVIQEGVAGPVGMVSITHQVAQVGIIPLLQFAAILSISLGVINLFPFPALDGGRLLFLGAELIIRRRVSPRIEAYVHMVGFALLMLLFVVVTYKDIARLFVG